MEKEEFLRTLGGALSGEVPQHIIQENLRYYDNYISDEMRKGRTEADIIEELGGPRIIARTIVDASFDTEDRPDGYETYGSGTVYDADSGSSGASGQENGQGPYGQDPFREEMHRNVHYVNLSGWKGRLIAGLVVFVILFLLMTVFFGVVGLAGLILSHTWPILLILLIIWIFAGRR